MHIKENGNSLAPLVVAAVVAVVGFVVVDDCGAQEESSLSHALKSPKLLKVVRRLTLSNADI